MPDALAALGLSLAPGPQLAPWQSGLGGIMGAGSGNGVHSPLPLFGGANPYLAGAGLGPQDLQLGLPPGGLGLAGW